VDDFERDIRFDVTVIEGLTERKQNMSSLLTLYKYKYKMELIKTSDSFKPGLKYTAFVSLFVLLYLQYNVLKLIIFKK
jgi:CD109 antigen